MTDTRLPPTSLAMDASSGSAQTTFTARAAVVSDAVIRSAQSANRFFIFGAFVTHPGSLRLATPPSREGMTRQLAVISYCSLANKRDAAIRAPPPLREGERA